MLRPAYRPEAIRDIDRHYTYLQAANPAAAARFIRQLRATIAILCEFPLSAPAWPQTRRPESEIRYTPLDGFARYNLFYEVLPPRLVAVRVLHHAEDAQRVSG